MHRCVRSSFAVTKKRALRAERGGSAHAGHRLGAKEHAHWWRRSCVLFRFQNQLGRVFDRLSEACLSTASAKLPVSLLFFFHVSPVFCQEVEPAPREKATAMKLGAVVLAAGPENGVHFCYLSPTRLAFSAHRSLTSVGATSSSISAPADPWPCLVEQRRGSRTPMRKARHTRHHGPAETGLRLPLPFRYRRCATWHQVHRD